MNEWELRKTEGEVEFVARRVRLGSSWLCAAKVGVFETCDLVNEPGDIFFDYAGSPSEGFAKLKQEMDYDDR